MDANAQEWFYVIDDDRRGPVDRKQLQRLFDGGAIASDTLIWTEGMSGWEPASDVFGKRRICPECGDPLAGSVPCECTKESPNSPPKRLSPANENHFAVAGFIVSLLALPVSPFTCGLSAIPGLALSIVGMVHASRHPESGRRALAAIGILVSILSFLLPVLIMFLLISFIGRSG